MPGDFVDIGEGGPHPTKVNFTTGERMVWDDNLARYERTGEGDPAWIRPTDSRGYPIAASSSALDVTGMIGLPPVAVPTPVASEAGLITNGAGATDATIRGNTGTTYPQLATVNGVAVGSSGSTVAAVPAAFSFSDIPAWAWLVAIVGVMFLFKDKK